MTGAAGVSDTFADYAADREEPRFTAWLRERAEPAWTDAVTHRFTRRLLDGTLDEDVFRRYLVQDYAFLRTLVGTFGHAVGEAPTMAAASRLVEFLATLTDGENDYFERAFDALEVPTAARESPALAEPTRAFRDLFERAARQGGYAETLSVVVPAEWIYREWASAAPAPSGPFYLTEWAELHATEEFDDFVAWLRTELDREGAAAAPRRQARLDRLFRRTVALEVAFFEAAHTAPADGGGN
jgi:thiaminase/transcriptional activator TenA